LSRCLRLVVEWFIFLKATVSRLHFFLDFRFPRKLDINILKPT
jgi:hypothetical protein